MQRRGSSNEGSVEPYKLDLSGQSLKRIIYHVKSDADKVTVLLLNNNELQKLEYMEKFPALLELYGSHNQIIRMYPVTCLRNIVKLDLSHNSILVIEGVKTLVNLKYLNLSSNKIKIIERMQNNLYLEHLDLSENCIKSIGNIHELQRLQKLYLHKNLISQLRNAELYFPKSLSIITLAGNKINDLNEFSHLAGLSELTEISIVSNPCVETFDGSPIAFDYRTFLINWCIELKIIDGFAVNEIERLKGEWLYSQGRGRKYKPGQHAELIKYLIETCPITNQSLMTEHERKLRLILSKAHQHQRQLKMLEQPGNEKELMTRSLDNALLESSSSGEYFSPASSAKKDYNSLLTKSLCDTSSSERKLSEEFMSRPFCSDANTRSPLPAATKLVPVPESLVSPLVSNPPPMPSALDTVTTPDQVADDKLQTIKQVAQIKKEEQCDNQIKEEQRGSLKMDEQCNSQHYEEQLVFHLKKEQLLYQYEEEQRSTEKSCKDQICDKENSFSAKVDQLDYQSKGEKCVNQNGEQVYQNGGEQCQNVESLYAFKEKKPSYSSQEQRSYQNKDGHPGGRSKEKPRISNNEDKMHANQNNIHDHHSNPARDLAALCIQKCWRGYRIRKLNPTVISMHKHLQVRRTHQHIQKLSEDVESIKAGLDNDHKLQNLQMQAMKALWRKVQELQDSMLELQSGSPPSPGTSICTQTDITAVGSLTPIEGTDSSTSISTQTDITALPSISQEDVNSLLFCPSALQKHLVQETNNQIHPPLSAQSHVVESKLESLQSFQSLNSKSDKQIVQNIKPDVQNS